LIMKALVVGGGARENAIADALIAGGAELYVYMPHLNPGLKKSAKAFTVGNVEDADLIVKFAIENNVELALIGPEGPLAVGVVDELEKKGIKCVGPTKEMAQLETSKSFTRNLVKKYGIKAGYEFKVFTKENSSEIEDYLDLLRNYVVKPDGLTGGKGVKLSGEHLKNRNDAVEYCEEVINAHGSVIVEEKLDGEEFSLQTLTDGKGGFLHFPIAQDHKRAFENDTGNNTGGMGSYSDSDFSLPFLSKEDVDKARKATEEVADAIVKELGSAYKGVMYGGFMKTAKGIKLLEYNARFGDPETMNVLPILKTSFVDVCKAVVEGKLSELNVEFYNKATVCKYVVPEGYPDSPVGGKIKVSPDTGALVYYASVEEKEDGLYTLNSRGIAFVGIADSIEEAEKIAEEAASKVEGSVFHRSDIGTKQLVQKRIDHIRQVMGKKIIRQLYVPDEEPMKVAAFMSGTGTNLRKILELQNKLEQEGKELFKVVMIFSDNGDESVCNAKKIAEENKIAYYGRDIKEYYRGKGFTSRKDLKVREEYDSETAKLLRIHDVDIVALCGYMSIVTGPVIDDFLTVNVHPADLRVKDANGNRKYSGCIGSDCTKLAIVKGDEEVRSTTHIVRTEVDEGPILLVSAPVKLNDFSSSSAEEVEEAAHAYQDKLKEDGDWKIYPETIRMLAEGKFFIDDKNVVSVGGEVLAEGLVMRA
jgi:phosphoribosylamine---glycine ligase